MESTLSNILISLMVISCIKTFIIGRKTLDLLSDSPLSNHTFSIFKIPIWLIALLSLIPQKKIIIILIVKWAKNLNFACGGNVGGNEGIVIALLIWSNRSHSNTIAMYPQRNESSRFCAWLDRNAMQFQDLHYAQNNIKRTQNF